VLSEQFIANTFSRVLAFVTYMDAIEDAWISMDGTCKVLNY
jgi:hypothetical protein